jgi:adenosylcobinamide-GDP ribazoletransferase
VTSPLRGLRLACAMFTVLPVHSNDPVDRRTAAAAVLWLPVIGLGLGAIASVPALLLDDRAGLLGAVLAVAILALLTRGLHLDGLADLVDGLGSRQPAVSALAIMRRSDIGAFGVAALLVTVLLDVSAIATLTAYDDRGQVLFAVIVATTTGRLAAVWAARPAVPSARPDGFGALVASSISWPKAAAYTVVLAGAIVAIGIPTHTYLPLLLAAGVGLLASGLVMVHIVRRLGGITGDVFGALIEATTAVVLVVAAIGAT